MNEIVSILGLAEAEVARLNEVNGAKDCRYFSQATCLYTPGTSAGSRSDETSRPGS